MVKSILFILLFFLVINPCFSKTEKDNFFRLNAINISGILGVNIYGDDITALEPGFNGYIGGLFSFIKDIDLLLGPKLKFSYTVATSLKLLDFGIGITISYPFKIDNVQILNLFTIKPDIYLGPLFYSMIDPSSQFSNISKVGFEFLPGVNVLYNNLIDNFDLGAFLGYNLKLTEQGPLTCIIFNVSACYRIEFIKGGK